MKPGGGTSETLRRGLNVKEQKLPAGPLLQPHVSSEREDCELTSMILRFTTMSEATTDAPCYFVGVDGARVGRDKENEISVPSDKKMAHVSHANIEFSDGSFYLIDKGFPSPASVRIGVGSHKRQWLLSADACFSAGSSVFRSAGVDKEGNLTLEIVEGCQKGEIRTVMKTGGTIGRSSNNTICVTDRELSRNHTKVEFDENTNQFFVSDMGSTNGTYMQLLGPYGGRFKLSLCDNILVGRSGFSINRFDFALSEERGYRPTMEDNNIIVQNLNIPVLNGISYLSPQSFFGVFDGHNGDQASLFLSQKLHVNLTHGLGKAAQSIHKICQDSNTQLCARCIDKEVNDDLTASALAISHGAADALDEVVVSVMTAVFVATDAEFLDTPNSHNGSTATTILLLGNRLYCANTGDSRTIISRYLICTITV